MWLFLIIALIIGVMISSRLLKFVIKRPYLLFILVAFYFIEISAPIGYVLIGALLVHVLWIAYKDTGWN